MDKDMFVYGMLLTERGVHVSTVFYLEKFYLRNLVLDNSGIYYI